MQLSDLKLFSSEINILRPQLEEIVSNFFFKYRVLSTNI